MIYQGQEVLISTLTNKDLVALQKGIESIDKEIIDIKFAVAPQTDFNLEYSVIIITKA